MKIKLYNDTPIHRDNFIRLAKAGHYDGTLFYRVIKNFMIQGANLSNDHRTHSVIDTRDGKNWRADFVHNGFNEAFYFINLRT